MYKDRFKFRVWDKFNSQMIYSEQIYFMDDKKDFKDTKIPFLSSEGILFFEINIEGRRCSIRADVQEDLNFIIMQCTGVKDRFGRLIYEGDVLDSGVQSNWKKIFAITYNENYGCFDYIHDDFHDISCYKIIGNIYERPELLNNE